MCLYSFFHPFNPGLVYPIFLSPIRPHKPTIIKPSFKSFTLFLCFCYCCMEYKAFHLLGEGKRKNGYENHQKKFISALYFAASKDKLNFISFSAPTSFPVFSLRVLGNTRYLLVAMRLKGKEEEWEFLAKTHNEKKRRKQFIRKVSLWFNKSPKNWKCYLHSFSFFIAAVFVSPGEKKSSRHKKTGKINPLCEIIQLFSRNFFFSTFVRNESFFVFPVLFFFEEIKVYCVW